MYKQKFAKDIIITCFTTGFFLKIDIQSNKHNVLKTDCAFFIPYIIPFSEQQRQAKSWGNLANNLRFNKLIQMKCYSIYIQKENSSGFIVECVNTLPPIFTIINRYSHIAIQLRRIQIQGGSNSRNQSRNWASDKRRAVKI